VQEFRAGIIQHGEAFSFGGGGVIVNIIVLKDGKSKMTPTIDIILDGTISQL
jgi:hypothetical protein